MSWYIKYPPQAEHRNIITYYLLKITPVYNKKSYEVYLFDCNLYLNFSGDLLRLMLLLVF